MTQKEITINGKTYQVAFTMATVLSFEEIADHSFFEEKFQRLRERMMLIFAAIYAADSNTSLKMEDLLKTDDWQEFNKAFETVMLMAAEFFKVPKVADELENKDQNDGNAKN